MLACVDVHYREADAVAACGVFREWKDPGFAMQCVTTVTKIEPYQPGQFFKRELPCILAVLEQVAEPIDTIIIDGYVWLGPNVPGMGAYLFNHFQGKNPVIGVAKTRFAGAAAIDVVRGQSKQPLQVTAAGISVETAAEKIRQMHGEYRLPALLKRVDQLCRGA